jgi:cytochrome c2
MHWTLLILAAMGPAGPAASTASLRGGWAVVTVENLPAHAVRGQTLPLEFTVRQHGVTLLPGLRPTVEMTLGGSTTRVAARPGKSDGRYVADLVFATAGSWNITIHSGFRNSKLALAPLSVVEPGAVAPPAPAEAEWGQQLFIGKGCVTCHTHGRLEGKAVGEVGPDLTDRRLSNELLREFLTQPRKNANGKNMPNLQLQQREITALMAFLNPRPAT